MATTSEIKVWLYKDGMNYVATRVTKGRHPKPGIRSERRTYGEARSKNEALVNLAKALKVKAEALVVTDLKATVA